MEAKKLIIISQVFYIFYIFLLLVYTFIKRKNAITNGLIQVNYFKTYQGEIPEDIAVLGRHFDNQFQVPILFFIANGILISSQIEIDYKAAILSWGFIFSRMAHSFSHLGKNRPLTRAKFYAFGWLFVLLQWIYILLLFY